mmetsp:Transcript_27666/g.82569  ORF Transcript_27666/g.82569 Transcript_27666/m.82569 type:complete len:555 (-) Transcript_27666:7-1671(-)
MAAASPVGLQLLAQGPVRGPGEAAAQAEAGVPRAADPAASSGERGTRAGIAAGSGDRLRDLQLRPEALLGLLRELLALGQLCLQLRHPPLAVRADLLAPELRGAEFLAHSAELELRRREALPQLLPLLAQHLQLLRQRHALVQLRLRCLRSRAASSRSGSAALGVRGPALRVAARPCLALGVAARPRLQLADALRLRPAAALQLLRPLPRLQRLRLALAERLAEGLRLRGRRLHVLVRLSLRRRAVRLCPRGALRLGPRISPGQQKTPAELRLLAAADVREAPRALQESGQLPHYSREFAEGGLLLEPVRAAFAERHDDAIHNGALQLADASLSILGLLRVDALRLVCLHVQRVCALGRVVGVCRQRTLDCILELLQPEVPPVGRHHRGPPPLRGRGANRDDLLHKRVSRARQEDLQKFLQPADVPGAWPYPKLKSRSNVLVKAGHGLQPLRHDVVGVVGQGVQGLPELCGQRGAPKDVGVLVSVHLEGQLQACRVVFSAAAGAGRAAGPRYLLKVRLGDFAQPWRAAVLRPSSGAFQPDSHRIPAPSAARNTP